MLFNSVEFFLFLPVVFALFYLLRHRYRLPLLLLASYYFYMSWNPIYIVLILISTAIDFTSGYLLGKTDKANLRHFILAISMLMNLGMLAYFKYANFFIDTLNTVVQNQGQPPFEILHIILPIGISFYTFQTMSYTIDVYHRKVESEKSILAFALYVCFFPQLVAGPIERYAALMPQLKARVSLSKNDLAVGLRLILYGLFMKMVIADNLGVLVDHAYAHISEMHSVQLIGAAVLYSFQIYCDFHGYSTIAIGAALLFGVRLSDNFKSPYFSVSLTQFWRRWHITLTNWFRDYIYYPMGGNRASKMKWITAVLVVFIVSGFWHGASWTFIVWGALHGVVTLAEKISRLDFNPASKWGRLMKGFITFSFVTGTWIFFRSPNFTIAHDFFTGMTNQWSLPIYSLDSLSHTSLTETFIYLLLFLILDYFTRFQNFGTWMESKSRAFRWSLYFVLAFLILGRSGTDIQPFIYFQF